MLNLQNDRVNSKFTRDGLGPLEWRIMELIWKANECSVRDVWRKLPQERAYTTVMTTLTRLFQKGIVNRRMVDRKFLYSARLSRQELEDAIARELCALLCGNSGDLKRTRIDYVVLTGRSLSGEPGVL